MHTGERSREILNEMFASLEPKCLYLFNQLRFHSKAVFLGTFQNSTYTPPNVACVKLIFYFSEVELYGLSALLVRDRKDKGNAMPQKCWLNSTVSVIGGLITRCL